MNDYEQGYSTPTEDKEKSSKSGKMKRLEEELGAVESKVFNLSIIVLMLAIFLAIIAFT
ncbi:hypothetical protein M8997_000985 [Phyllobacterium sp. 21LDTY02-6]|uniref:hypothetical protein n=1 Tax=unclassified Phyllobacterium TaxID=2638441 RepID=UPI002021369F|nr:MULTISPECIES: hypothetical protein [unclassified Phyllobacterium]MCO4315742.1 hypothetical protein [Phyllobacterium sp. 21LDTY02-6]MCX8280846.1 hypothetical protein [Phyllobacterium sp. 0TCS1.6C]MCX8295712.1 hypothetical protein [Phyllobacterium sp. 0TCS1.6A]